MSEVIDYFIKAAPICAGIGLVANWGTFVRSFRRDGPDPEAALKGVLMWVALGPLCFYVWLSSMPGFVVKTSDFLPYCALLMAQAIILFGWSRFESGTPLKLNPAWEGLEAGAKARRVRSAMVAFLVVALLLSKLIGPSLARA